MNATRRAQVSDSLATEQEKNALKAAQVLDERAYHLDLR